MLPPSLWGFVVILPWLIDWLNPLLEKLPHGDDFRVGPITAGLYSYVMKLPGKNNGNWARIPACSCSMPGRTLWRIGKKNTRIWEKNGKKTESIQQTNKIVRECFLFDLWKWSSPFDVKREKNESRLTAMKPGYQHQTNRGQEMLHFQSDGEKNSLWRKFPVKFDFYSAKNERRKMVVVKEAESRRSKVLPVL